MIAALCYLQYHSTRNRLFTRFKRLRQPKYLVGAIVGGLYFYTYFFRYLFHNISMGPQNGGFPFAAADISQLYQSIGALALFVIVLFSWIVPHERAALTFTEAEVAFLFPAPVKRRTLIHFKLLRSQMWIFFSTLLLSLFSRRFGGAFWTHALGWWLVLSTLNLHFLGSSFARTLLLDRGVSNGLRRLLVFFLVGIAAVAVWIWARQTLPPLTGHDTMDFHSLMSYARRLLNAGPAFYLLYPFRLLTAPFFAPDAAAFLAALAPALLLFLLHYVWVIFSDVAFEEASVEASQKMAKRLAAARAGNWRGARKTQRARRAWFTLAPSGPVPAAFMWKNLVGIGGVFSPRLWMVIAVVCVAFFLGFGGAAHAQNLSMLAAIFLAVALAYSLLLGPQLLRLDFRRDLPMADLLKTFPLRGWQIALGELLAPVIALTCFQWFLLLAGVALAIFFPVEHRLLMFSVAFSAAVVLPVMNFLLLLIPNTAVLLFPSWIQAGKDSPRGIEATGQRLVFAIGQLLVLLLSLAPVSVAFAAVYFPLKIIIGPVAPILPASLAAAIVLALEAALGVWLLGKLFVRFDVTEEPGS